MDSVFYLNLHRPKRNSKVALLIRYIHKSRRVFLFFHTFTLISLFLAGCFEIPPEPIAPSWTTQLSIPLIDTIYYLEDAFEKNPNIITHGDQFIYKPDKFEFDSIEIGKRLKLNPELGVSFSHNIGLLSVQFQSPVKITLTASEIIGVIPPDPSPIPPINSTKLNQDFPVIQEFEYAHFQSGTLHLTIRNSLPIPIQFPNGLKLYNQLNNELIALFDSGTVQPHATWIPNPQPLDNKLVRNLLHLETQYQSKGSNGTIVSVSPDSGLTISVEIENSRIDEIYGRVFEQVSVDTTFQTFIVDDSTFIELLLFNSGGLNIQMEKNVGIDLDVQMRANEFRSLITNNTFVFNSTLTNNLPITYPINFTEWKIQSSQPTNKVTFRFSAITRTSNLQTPVLVRATDSVVINIIPFNTPYTIREFKGISKPIYFNLNDTIHIPLGRIPEIFSADSVMLDSITMRIKLLIAGGHTTDIDANILGLNADGSIIDSMRIPPDFNGKRRIEPGFTEIIEFNRQNSSVDRFISRFLSNKANQIIIHGKGIVNPPDIYQQRISGTMRDTTNLYSSLELNIPLRVGIFNGRFIDTAEVENNSNGKSDSKSDQIEMIEEAVLYFVIKNAIPATIDLQQKFLDSSGITLFTLPKSGDDSLKIKAGSASNPSFTPKPIALRINIEDAKKLEDVKKIILRLGFDSGGQIAVFRTTDYIRIRSFATLKVKVNHEN